MIITEIKNVYGINFKIESNKQLQQEDITEIEKLNLDIYFNDLKSYHWSFDTKLKTGNWLENIAYNNELTEAKATIYN